MSYPNVNDLIKPWSWNFLLDLTWIFTVILLITLIWVWTRSGKDRKNLPDILGRNIEDFAGVTQEGNGPIPLFLLLLYAIIAFVIVAYPLVTLIFNYKY